MTLLLLYISLGGDKFFIIVGLASSVTFAAGYFDSSSCRVVSLTLTLKGVMHEALVAVESVFFKMLLRITTF